MTTITLPDSPKLNNQLSKSYNDLLAMFVKEVPVISMLAELYRPKAVVTATVTADETDPETAVDVRISYTIKYSPIIPGILNTQEHWEFENYVAQCFAHSNARLNEMNSKEANPS